MSQALSALRMLPASLGQTRMPGPEARFKRWITLTWNCKKTQHNKLFDHHDFILFRSCSDVQLFVKYLPLWSGCFSSDFLEDPGSFLMTRDTRQRGAVLEQTLFRCTSLERLWTTSWTMLKAQKHSMLKLSWWAEIIKSEDMIAALPVWGDSAGLVKHMHGTCTCPDNTTTHAATKSIHRHQHIESKHFIIHYHTLPVVPHKAVAEVSKLGRYRRGELLWCMDGKANPLMDRKVVGVVLFGVLAVVTSTTTAGCSVV